MRFPTRGHPDIDPTELRPLLEESQDLHRDSMVETNESLTQLVELGHEQRAAGPVDLDEHAEFEAARDRNLSGAFGGKLLVAAGAGAALATLLSSEAFADAPADIQMLQTAASIENLAVATYTTALTLDFIGGASANGVVKAFATTTLMQHQQHAAAFNAAIAGLNGKQQMNPDPVLLQVVTNAKPGLTSALPVVNLALELEEGAAQTYVAFTSAFTDATARKVTASIMGVEAQHAAVLLAVQALLTANAPQLIALPPNAAALPGAAGSVGFPQAFYPTNQARPANEGAVS